MTRRRIGSTSRWLLGALTPLVLVARPVRVVAADSASVVSPELIGRTVEQVVITGNTQVSSEVILHIVRTKEGEKFEPATVEEDYQRIFGLKRFSNVQAKVEPTATGVNVIFQVTEQRLMRAVRFQGNRSVPTDDLQRVTDLKPGEAIEPFRISVAKRAIVSLYKTKNFPFTRVDVDNDELKRTGDITFKIVEGQPVAIRKIAFVGANSFTQSRLNDLVKTTRYYWVFNPGTYDSQQLDEDVAAVHQFYKENGFWDVKVGRKLVISPDQTEMQINFLIEEGVRYRVGSVSFVGNKKIASEALHRRLKMTEGLPFDAAIVSRDVREIVAAYSKFGYIYDPRSSDPNYLRIGRPAYEFVAHVIVREEPGVLDLVYEISEGKPFYIDQILVRGNSLTRLRVVLNNITVSPGQLYNSEAVEDSKLRLQGVPAFERADITPIGNRPDSRDLDINVKESEHTAKVGVGAQVNSNLGLGGNFTYEQRNFDILNVPTRFSDILSEHAFTGAGQTLIATFQPGVDVTTASVEFIEPYLFDQPYSGSSQAYYRQVDREWGYERRAGGSITIGKQINDFWTASVTFQAEDVKIGGIQNAYPLNERTNVIDPITRQPSIDPKTDQIRTQLRTPRAPDVIERAGHNTVTNIGLLVRRDTVNHGPLKYEGTNAQIGYQAFGALGGQYTFSEFTGGFDGYSTLYTDLLDRKTVLNFHLDAGYIIGDAPFFDRFYGGGRGSIRGFEYRGVGPRAGRDLDPIGGALNLVGTVELNYPIYGENVRGVVFTDFGTVEPGLQIHTIRQSVGAGLRVVIPFVSREPLAFDVAFPLNTGRQDLKQIFSFGVAYH